MPNGGSNPLATTNHIQQRLPALAAYLVWLICGQHSENAVATRNFHSGRKHSSLSVISQRQSWDFLTLRYMTSSNNEIIGTQCRSTIVPCSLPDRRKFVLPDYAH